ncbi:MAG TPA: hypothetical protein PLV42_05535 [bacterium]|nr:hypothetical protein [bacterium]
MARSISLDNQLKRVEINSFVVENELIHGYFSGVPEADREERLFKALYIGVLALMEERLGAFLAKTKNELGTELEYLKILFDMKKFTYDKTTGKGKLAERDIFDFLTGYLKKKNIADTVTLTGDKAGDLPRNKTGDIVCDIADNGGKRIAIECKFDKGVALGDSTAVNITQKRADTAWSQLLEAQVNRGADISLIVFDKGTASASIVKACDGVIFLPEVGFVVVIDSQKDDYTNLAIAYLLARDIAIHAKPVELDKDTLAALVNRIVTEMRDFLSIRALVEANIENNREILKKMQKGLLTVEFTAEYLSQFLQSGIMTRKDFLDFTRAEDIRTKYKAIEQGLEKI